MSNAVIIKDAVKKYGDLTVLKGISLDIKEGEFFTLLGPSGCGKTTLLRQIAGFNSIEGGEFYFGDKLINTVPAHKRDIGMVFQNYAIFPHLTVEENVAYGLKARHVPKAEIAPRVQEALELVQIGHLAKRKPSELSGGQQQRVAIARALVNNPEIICLDEPLSNLDAKLRVQLREELKEMQAKFGITTVYVTHDQEEALTLSDCIAVFNKGFIEQIGTPDEIYSQSKTEFVCNFIGDINKLEPRLIAALNAQTDRPVNPDKHAYVRLERIHVNDASRAGRARFQGKVVGNEYFGLYIKYQLDVEGQTLKCIDKNDGRQYLRKGDSVEVSIDPADLMVY